jgi:hypothetical protein
VLDRAVRGVVDSVRQNARVTLMESPARDASVGVLLLCPAALGVFLRPVHDSGSLSAGQPVAHEQLGWSVLKNDHADSWAGVDEPQRFGLVERLGGGGGADAEVARERWHGGCAVSGP